jgi:hypothetical protein
MARRQSKRLTFRQQLEVLRNEAAERVWQRARVASHLRHAALASGYRRTATALGQVKAHAIQRALDLVPDEIVVTIDTHRYVGLQLVRWNGHGGFHLPWSIELVKPLNEARRSA